jgi:hypothetical protein
MKTIEFKSVVEDNVIRIPEVYRGIFSTPVVVILKESNAEPFSEHQENKKITDKDLIAPCISTKGWKFNREEAHER